MNNMNLQSLDKLFGGEAGAECMIKLSELRSFKNHPFHVIENAEMKMLAESVAENGILSPIIVRRNPYEPGTYEILSGHRRVRAAKLSGLTEVPCLIRDLTDSDATILMVDSNMAREHILPSEKAFAYKLRLDAQKQQGKRTDLSEEDESIRTAEEISRREGESCSNIYRYIRLTNLIRQLLDLVDAEIMTFMAGVYLSFLSDSQQQEVWNYYSKTGIIPSKAQAELLKKLASSPEMTDWDFQDSLISVMEKDKADDVDVKPRRVVFNQKELNEFTGAFPQNVTEDYIKDIIIRLLSKWQDGEIDL